jgi:septum formation protein
MPERRLILASASPRRQVLLKRLWEDFDVQPCPFDEPRLRSSRVSPRSWAEALAYYKARAIADRYPECWVLGADTIVVCGGSILGKPRDADDARRMLEAQAREPSDVITGVGLVRLGAESERTAASDVTRVWMRDDARVREEYLEGGDWAGKAGAYGIQNIGDRLVERWEGSFTNVVGLPVRVVTELLRKAGFSVPEVMDEA